MDIVSAIAVLAGIALVAGLALTLAARTLQRDADDVVERINAELPQTQCAQCGFPGCRPYAEAIAQGDVDINRCPPGGDATIAALARLLDRDIIALDASLPPPAPPGVAIIDEERCIGCARCLPACPVDAIVGAHQFMHTVVEDLCTGCELCIAPCPVDCIEMVATDDNAERAA
ncbi:MAG: electron transport complex subunit RsxB [Pseudomonadota bacterium]